VTGSSLVGTIALPVFLVLCGLGVMAIMIAGAVRLVEGAAESRARAAVSKDTLKALVRAEDAISCAIADAAGDGLNTITDDTVNRLVAAHELLTTTRSKELQP